MSLEVIHGGYAWPGREPVLRDVDFSFDGTGVMSILGPNGAGKTTLLRCMLGLLKLTEGEALLDGRPVGDWKPRDFWRTIGYVPQAKLPGFASMTLADMVVLGRSARIGPFSLPSDADWAVVDRVMAEVGIDHLAGRLCSEVSGGQFQLALIARPLRPNPASWCSTSLNRTSTSAIRWWFSTSSSASPHKGSAPSSTRTFPPTPWKSPPRRC